MHKRMKTIKLKTTTLLQVLTIMMLIVFLVSFVVLMFYSPIPSNIIMNSNHNFLQIRKQSNNNEPTTPATEDVMSIKIEESSTTFAIYKSHGSYNVITYVGSNEQPQKQVLILDTGSHYTAFPCNPCLTCGKHTSKYFDPELSTTNQIVKCNTASECNMEASSCTSDNQCQLTVRYTEGSSWTAYEHIDHMWLSNAQEDTQIIQSNHKKHAAPVSYGCQFYESGLFRKQYEDGILGMAMHPTKMITATYKNHGSISHNSFSICLNNDNNKDEKGFLTLGGVHPSMVTKDNNMQFTNIVDNPNGWYVVHIDSVYVGTQSLATSNILRDNKQKIANSFNTKERGTIIDSGTTDIYLPSAIAPMFIRIWESYMKMQFTNTPIDLSYEEYLNIPNVTLILDGGYHWELQPKYYMEPVLVGNNQNDNHDGPWKGKKTFINRIYLNEPNGAVLGVNAMLGHDIYFDIENKRIGFAKSDCNI